VKRFNLSESGDRGWFIGDFERAVVRTDQFEVNWQTNARGHGINHYHKVITEVQLVTRGRMLVNGTIFGPGDICMLEPGDISQIDYLEEVDTVCIKFPSVPNDKYEL
jgi:hypothetical protein